MYVEIKRIKIYVIIRSKMSSKKRKQICNETKLEIIQNKNNLDFINVKEHSGFYKC